VIYQLLTHVMIVGESVALLLNRLLDMGFTFVNALIALTLLNAPWYRVTADVTYLACPLTRGTVIAPFTSGLCHYDDLSSLPDGEGDKWATIGTYVIIYFCLSLILTMVVGYEAITNGVRELDNGNTISFVLNMILVILITIIMALAGKLETPDNTEALMPINLMVAALVVSCVRIPFIGWVMYKTKQNNPTGYFGTGAGIGRL